MVDLKDIIKKEGPLTCRRALLRDLPRIAAEMREEDKQEVLAFSGLSPLAGLICGFNFSDESFVVYETDTEDPLFIFGYTVIEPPDLTACIWLLGTDKIKKHSRQFLQGSGLYIDYLQTKAKLLYNFVDQRNLIHIRWLKWLGFKFIKIEENFGYEQRPFIEFARLRN